MLNSDPKNITSTFLSREPVKVTFLGEEGFAVVSKLRILRLLMILDYQGDPIFSSKCPHKRRALHTQRVSESARGNVKTGRGVMGRQSEEAKEGHSLRHWEKEAPL